ncbi:MAG: hypothetical protein LC100_06215 [Chitinophagales bacterium]|nr:hypothetical protein [Chitinophagales bacterium]
MAIIWNKIIPRWGGDTIEPPEAKKDTGYIAGDKPPAKWENWLRKGTYEALDETRDVIEDIDSQLAQIVSDVEDDALELSNHKTDLITDADGTHGLRVQSGVWTPTLGATVTAGSHAYTIRAGRYIKINDKVYVSCFVRCTVDNTINGNVEISGLPFVSTFNLPRGICSVAGAKIPLTNSYTQLTATQEAGTSVIRLKKLGNALVNQSIVGTDIRNIADFEIELNCEYTTY